MKGHERKPGNGDVKTAPMRLLSAEGVREADRRAMENAGIPGVILMENAAMRVTEAILSLDPLPQKVVILAGPGNNGGDGLVVARHLQALGTEVEVFCTAPAEKYRGDARTNLDILLKRGFPVQYILDEESLEELKPGLERADLVVDALLGTGTSRPVEGRLASIIRLVNASGAPVLAVDIPSGIHADTGQVLGLAVQADWTVTFAFPKKGLLLFPGAEYSGRTTVGEIYIPEEETPCERVEIITPSQVEELLPPRPRNAHKGTFGKTLIVAGSPGMTGAAVLTAESALKGGAGLVYLAAAPGLRSLLDHHLVEAITLEMPPEENSREIISSRAAESILSLAEGCSVLALGPGLPPDDNTYRLLENLLPSCPVPLILDAGALAALSRDPLLLHRAASPVAITPHPGEASRLLHLDQQEIVDNRLEISRRMAEDWGVVTVLKGSPTVVSLPDGSSLVNSTGGPSLSTAGTGDLLTGLMAALVSQGSPLHDAACCGVFLHGLAGDIASREGRGRGLKAGDILQSFPAAFATVENRLWLPPAFGPFHREITPQF